jgi:dCMP deaminase
MPLECLSILATLPRPTRDETNMLIAVMASMRGTCGRRKVGCVIVDAENRILSYGYNGVGKGAIHCTDSPCPGVNMKSGSGLDVCEAVHAETNAIVNCTDLSRAFTLYVTASPCNSCMKLLLNTDIDTIVYLEDYPGTPWHLWHRDGRSHTKLEM